MKRQISFLVIGLLLILSLVCCNGCVSKIKGVVSPPLSTSELIDQEGKSTVALMIYINENETTQTSGYKVFCTGVWVDDTHIMSANHCAKAVQEYQQQQLDARKQQMQGLMDRLPPFLQGSVVQEPDTIEEKGLVIHYIEENEVTEYRQEPSAWHMSKVLAFDESHDLVLLTAQGKAIPGHKVAKLADSAPALGEKVHIVGMKSGLFWSYIEGNVSAYRGTDMITNGDDVNSKGPWMQVSAPVYFGDSGGGCFNDHGELVGITDWIKDARDASFFIHVETLRSFLKDNLPK